jgi:hypothetical protein
MTQSTTPEDPSRAVSDGAEATRTFLVGVALLGFSAVGALLIINGFEYLQNMLGFESFALTFLVGSGLATLWLAIFGVIYLWIRPVNLHYGFRWLTLRDAGWIIGGTIVAVVVALLIEIVVIPFGDGGATNITSAAAVENPY